MIVQKARKLRYNASGIMHFINQLGLNKAREMLFLATPIKAEDALNVGLINHIAEPEKLEEMLEEQFLNPLLEQLCR